MMLAIILEGGEGHRQRPGIAKRAQPQIDPEYETLRCRFRQGLGQPLTQPAEKLLIADRPCSVGLTLLGIGKNQINIRRKVEFTSTEFAHAQHDQLLRLTVSSARNTVTPALFLMQPIQCRANCCFRQISQIAQGFSQIGQSGQIAPGDSHHLPPAESA